MFERFYLIFSKANPFRHRETKYIKFSISQRLKKKFYMFSVFFIFIISLFS